MTSALHSSTSQALVGPASHLISRPGNVLRFLWTLARHARPETTPRALGRRLEFLLRLLPLAPWVQQLRPALEHERLQFLQPLHPALFDKLRHPYQDRHWGIARRTALISDHYEWMLQTFDQRTLESLYLPGGITLARFGDAEAPARIHLLFDRSFSKEGELMLVLFGPTGQRMATLAFAVSRSACNRERVLRIGGLQGDKGASREQFKLMTKDCHGLRPLALLVATAQLLAGAWNIEQVCGISNERHIFSSRRYWHRSHLRVQRSYDELWQELGGTLVQGWFQLATCPEVRDPSTAPSNKRAMYVRRQALMQELGTQVQKNWRQGSRTLVLSVPA